MPRTGRIVLPDYPHHIVQSGHNRQSVFTTDDDYGYYLDTLATFKDECGVKVYGFCLMPDHVHLLLEPVADSDGLAQLMKRAAGRQTRFHNRQANRAGTLWEGRYRSSPVDGPHYLLPCLRFIETNPVRRHRVGDPAAYRWSSYHHHAGLETLPWLDPAPGYLGLAASAAERARAYCRYVAAGVPPEQGELITNAVRREQLTGEAEFVDRVERLTGRRVETRRPGRPRKRHTPEQ